jgi:hypothetical protein
VKDWRNWDHGTQVALVVLGGKVLQLHVVIQQGEPWSLTKCTLNTGCRSRSENDEFTTLYQYTNCQSSREQPKKFARKVLVSCMV